MTKKISTEVGEGKFIDLTIYEIPIDEQFLNETKNEETLNSFLFECQCALFLFDITKSQSFDLIKSLINMIDFKKFSYMKPILVQNTIGQGTDEVPEAEVSEFINSKNFFEIQKISNKNKTGIDELKAKIAKAINNSPKDLPMNIVSESNQKNSKLINGQGYLSFILIGDTTVGKTAFFNRYFRDDYKAIHLTTIGIEKESKLVKIGDETNKITLWDTAGQERFKCLPRKYYQNADGIFLIFDVTKEETFNNVSSWINDVKNNSNRNVGGENGQPPITLYLIGNKIDSPERTVSTEQGEKLASSLGMKYFEISCKLNMNIPEVMSRMIMETYMKTNHINDVNEFFKLSTKNQKKKEKKKGGFC